MRKYRTTITTCSLGLLLPFAVRAGHADPAAPINELVVLGFVILIVAVGVGVYFSRSRDPKEAPLNSVLGTDRPDPHAVAPDTSVKDCVRKMDAENVGAVLVVENEKLVGIFTERDALRKVLAAGLNPASTEVSMVMTRDPTAITPDTNVGDAMKIITSKRFRHLPVVREGKVLGLVSSGDLTHWVVKDQMKEIQELVDMAETK